MALRPLSALRSYQPAGIDILVQRRRCAALLKPGLGKTVMALMALQRLGTKRTLVVVPAQVCESEVWSQEAAAWEATSGMHVSEMHGGPD